MTPHTHREYVPGCYRCELSRDEVSGVERGQGVATLPWRMAAKIVPDEATGCWNWTGTKSDSGYGRVSIDGRAHQAHRIAYEILRAQIPDGMQIDHLCRNRACLNPDHMEPVTQRENIMRGESVSARNARRNHCNRGHEYVQGSFIMERSKSGLMRRCLICQDMTEEARARREGFVRRRRLAGGA